MCVSSPLLGRPPPGTQKHSPASRGSICSRRNLEHLDEGELFMELIRDISNELDINILCHKILVNVGLLTHADRASLFLAKGTPNNRYLVAKLFDVTQNNGEYYYRPPLCVYNVSANGIIACNPLYVRTHLVFDEAIVNRTGEEIIIPFGVGIAGAVAETKNIINIKNAYEDPRFNCEIDQRTGYKTNTILSMPICNYDDDVIGVAQIINKTNGKCGRTFTEWWISRESNGVDRSLCLSRKRRVHGAWCRGVPPILDVLRHRHPKCPIIRNVGARVPSEPNAAELGAEHFRGAEQPRVLGYQNPHRSEGITQMSTFNRFSIGSGLLRVGELLREIPSNYFVLLHLFSFPFFVERYFFGLFVISLCGTYWFSKLAK